MKTAANVWGDWQHVATDVREGLACLRFLEADENEIDSAELEAATNNFREERNLIAAEDMISWLSARGLDADEWVAYVQRRLARARCAADLATIVETFPVEDEEVAAATECESICSGAAAVAARKLAAAATHAIERGTLDASIGDVAGRLAAIEAEAKTDTAMEHALEAHRLDWTTIECRLVRFADDDAAHEAALCVREENENLAAVALAAGTAVEEKALLLQQCDADLQAKLLSAPPGSLVGPFPFEGQPTLVVVLEKRSPEADDPQIRVEAGRALVDGAIDRLTRAVHFDLEL